MRLCARIGRKSPFAANFFRQATRVGLVLTALACWHSRVCTGQARATETSPDPSACHPQALVTSYNDIRLERDDRPPGKPATIPASVIERLRNAAKVLLSQVPPGTADGVTCEDLFPNTYRISIPEHRELFVAEIYVGRGNSFFHFIVHDPRTGAVTRNPPWVGAKWPQLFGAQDPLVKKPLVSSADLFQNHHPQIVFEERVHNGTMYNAVVYHYFDVRPDLSLTRVLARETRLMALEPDDAIFIRELSQLSPTRLRLDTFELLSPDSAQRKQMGYVVLQSAGPGIPFHVVQRDAKDLGYLNCLITCDDESPDDDAFLREGYTFYY